MEKLKEYLQSSRFLFCVVLVLSIAVLLLVFLPEMMSLLGTNILFLWILHALSGIVLVINTYREKISGKLKFFLLSLGFSSAGFFLGVVLHNIFYALGTLTEDLQIIHDFLNFLEVVFFFIAVIACPIGLLIGTVGTLIHWKKHEN